MALVISKQVFPKIDPSRTTFGTFFREKFMNFTDTSCRIAHNLACRLR